MAPRQNVLNWNWRIVMNRLSIAIAAALVIVWAQGAFADDLAGGKKIYTDNCQRCHGNSGQGAIGKKLVGDAAYWDFAIFKRTVMDGVDDEGKKMKVMPVWGKTGLDKPKGEMMTDVQLEDLQTYLKTFGPAE